MNNEQYEQIIDEAYDNYQKNAVVGDVVDSHYEPATNKWYLYNNEEFIDKIKKDDRFAQKWSVTVYTEVDNDEVWMGIIYNNRAAKVKIK
jgi:phosphatidylserine decarboxylase